jgi:hypothetical protein
MILVWGIFKWWLMVWSVVDSYPTWFLQLWYPGMRLVHNAQIPKPKSVGPKGPPFWESVKTRRVHHTPLYQPNGDAMHDGSWIDQSTSLAGRCCSSETIKDAPSTNKGNQKKTQKHLPLGLAGGNDWRSYVGVTFTPEEDWRIAPLRRDGQVRFMTCQGKSWSLGKGG